MAKAKDDKPISIPKDDKPISILIAEQLESVAPAVKEKVIEAIVDREVEKRAGALVKAIDMMEDAIRVDRRIKEDVIGYDADGKVVSAVWSKSRLEEKNKSAQNIAKIQKAIDKGLAGDFSEVYSVINNKSDGGGKPQDQQKATASTA